MAYEAGIDWTDFETDNGFNTLKTFEALVRADEREIVMNEPINKEHWQRFEDEIRADERRNKPHSLGPGEMELSLRREHNGELFEYRHRFSAVQVMHGPIFMVTDAAKRMDDEIDAAIRARGETK
jgi:hypothetical protein